MRKSVLYAAIAVLLASVYVTTVLPLYEKREAVREKAALNYRLTEKYRKLSGGGLYTPLKLKEARTELEAMEAGLVNGSDLAVGFADLQLKLQTIATKAGMRVVAINPLFYEEYAFDYIGVPISMEAHANTKDLSSFLKSIDNDSDYLSVDKLSVRVSKASARRPLTVRMVIEGLARR